MNPEVNNGANIINAIQNLIMAKEQFEDFCRQYPNSQGSRLFKKYSNKIKFYASRNNILNIHSLLLPYETFITF